MTYNIDIGTFAVGLIGICIACHQLKKINKQITIAITNQKMDFLKIILEIETQINQRKSEFDKISISIQIKRDKFDKNEQKGLMCHFDAAKENYLNAVDRLCFCIDQNISDKKNWKKEYKEYLEGIIRQFPDDFDEASPYDNIKKVHAKWSNT